MNLITRVFRFEERTPVPLVRFSSTRGRRACLLLCMCAWSLPAFGLERIASGASLVAAPAANPDARLLTDSESGQGVAVSDTYSLAPLAQDSGAAYYLTAGSPTQHTFDGLDESAGTNLRGSAGGYFSVIEGAIPLGGGHERIVVEVTAVNSNGFAEPWISAAHSDKNYVNWRLDVGSDAGGTNRIQPATAFTKTGSGVNLFSSSGQALGNFALTLDSSNATALSGVAILGIGGANIAGYNVATLQMYWDILPAPTDLALQEVDASDGAYLPGSDLDVRLKIANLGATNSGSCLVHMHASPNTSITEADPDLGSAVLPSLQAGEVLIANTQVTFPANLAVGSYYIGGILDCSDSNSANNTQHDPNPIVVSTQPEILVRPLLLDFNPSEAPGANVQEYAGLDSAAAAMTRAVLPQLIQQAQDEGKLRVIVGLAGAFQPEGELAAAGKQSQRQDIARRRDQVLALLQGSQFRENRRFRFIPFVALTVDAAALQRLAGSALVANIATDPLAYPTLASSNAVIGAPLAWAEGYDGTGQTIAVLDTGVDKTHPWFSTGGNKVVSEACYSGSGLDSVSLCPGGAASSTAAGSGLDCDAGIDECDHGTHVAGIAAGNDGAGPRFGVARGANLIAMQVFSRLDDPADCEEDPAPCLASFASDQIAALERVYELKDTFSIAAVNMSLGGQRFFDQASCDAAHPAMVAAIATLRSVNIPTVIASGNDGWKDSISAPACVSPAISVGNSTDSDAVFPGSNIYPQIHLLAPGTSITSAVPGGGTATYGGTSMAAPHVAGAFAVLKQRNPANSVSVNLAALQTTGTPVDDLRPGGTVTDMPRINLDLAMGDPRTTFGIFNQGPGVLNITSITRETPAAWISWTPQAPFSIQPGQLQVVEVTIDFDAAPGGVTETRLLINSNDPNESPYPGGVVITVDSSTGEVYFSSGFE